MARTSKDATPDAAPAPLAYARPDTDPDFRDDDAGLLLRQQFNHPVSWAFHGSAFAFLTIAPVSHWVWTGFPIERNPFEAILTALVAIGLGVLGVFALLRPTNWREVYLDVRNGRVNVRWQRWLRPGGKSFDLRAFDRVVLVEEVDGRRVTPDRLELRQPWAKGEPPTKVLASRQRPGKELEPLARRIAERSGLRFDRVREQASS